MAAVQNMEICSKKKIINIILSLIFLFSFINHSDADLNFKSLENKKVSFLNFFLLKFENSLIRKSQILKRQMFATRVQYSNIAIEVDLDNKREKIFINFYAVMDRIRYTKKKYNQKLSDCNQIRNLVFYQKPGYKFFTQKRDPTLSVGVMEDIFKEIYFNNIDLSEDEAKFLMDKMYVKITILHPVNKTELTCSGKINDYVLQ